MRQNLFLGVFLFISFIAPTLSAGVLPEATELKTLENGLKVVLVPWDSPGMVAYYSVVRAGSRDETDPGYTGFAHLFEHMMFRGTKNFTDVEYRKKITAFGAENSGYTTQDYTCYHTFLPTEVLPDLIELEADRFQNLDFPEQVFMTETGAVEQEYAKRVSNPISAIFEKLRETAFEKHTYGHTVIGYLKDIKAMPGYFDYAHKFYKRFYTPDNVTILVVGDFQKDAVFAKITEQYGAWAGKRDTTETVIEPPQTAPRSVHISWNSPAPDQLLVSYKMPSFTLSPSYAAFDVLSLLVFGETSPLYQKLVVEEQKLLSLSGFSYMSRDPFLYSVYGSLAPGTGFVEIETAIEDALREAAAGNIPPKRIEDAKSHVRYTFLTAFETADDMARTLTEIIGAVDDPAALDSYADMLTKVTTEDIQAVATKYLQATNKTTVTLAQTHKDEKKGGSQ